MSNNRAERITSIIEKRRPLVVQIERVLENLKTLDEAARDFEVTRDQISALADEEVRGMLRDVDFGTIRVRINDEVQALTRLKTRFSRNTLNIGVVGRARQGKSRMLQSLSGLSALEIPDGDGLHCTGVRSIITHNPIVEPYGEVWFHTERSFLDEVIAPYYGPELLNTIPPSTLQEFVANPLPPQPESPYRQTELSEKYNKLVAYKENLGKYRDLLSEPSPRRIPMQLVREYVAQRDLSGETLFYNYIAVREVKIVCSFPKQDLGSIALVDMPGLGDTGIGDEQRLVKTLGEDVDVAVFVRMPRTLGDYWADVDVTLYDTASRALASDLPLERWAFLVLNHTVSGAPQDDNIKNCDNLIRTKPEKMGFVKSLIANCASPDETNEIVLEELIRHLAEKIAELDAVYASSCQDRLHLIQQAVVAVLEKARQVLGPATSSGGDHPLFVKLFNQVWNDLTVGLTRLVDELRDRRGEAHPGLEEGLQAVLSECRRDTGVPTLEEIARRRDMRGSYLIAYHEYLHEIRTHLSRKFLALDGSLKTLLDGTRSRVAQVLLDTGRLQPLSASKNTRFLAEAATTVPDSMPKIKLGLTVLAGFELSYRGFIQHRVREHLDILTPDVTAVHASTTPSAEEIHAMLESLHGEALYEVQSAFDGWLSEPSQVTFAIVEEFVDQVLRSDGAHDEWRNLYQELRSEIWPREFERFETHSRVRRQWDEAVLNIAAAAEPNRLQFLA
jgi:hypothetical protein